MEQSFLSDKIKVIFRWSWQRPNGFQKGISFQNENKLNFSKSKPVESQISKIIMLNYT